MRCLIFQLALETGGQYISALILVVGKLANQLVLYAISSLVSALILAKRSFLFQISLGTRIAYLRSRVDLSSALQVFFQWSFVFGEFRVRMKF